MSATDNTYQAKDRYEAARRALLKDLVPFTEGGPLRRGFMRDFYRLLDDLTFGLVKDGEDFYALFTRDMTKDVDFSLTWPLATVLEREAVHLLFNPISFLFLREAEARALIKHEVMHLILDHHSREGALKNRYSQLAINLAMDVAVNQYIPFLPAFCEKLNSVNARLDLDLQFNETLEHYTAQIDRALHNDQTLEKKFKKDHGVDFKRAHDAWTRGNDQKAEASREKLSRMLKQAGKLGYPDEISSLIKPEGPPKISWGETLRKTLISMPAGRRKTVTRRNRRQPERLDLKGELRDFVPEVIVAFDISASIQDKDMKQFLTEILGITANYRRSIRVIECDDQIRADYRVTSPKDIRPMAQRRGGTAFTPVFELLKEEGRSQCLLVYFTDGQGEEALGVKPRHEILWIVTGPKLSLERPYGKIIYLASQKKAENKAFGLEAMRELLHEWAR